MWYNLIMNFRENYLDNKRVVVEVLLAIIFSFFAVQYLGIPDIYDFYIYLILSVLFVIDLIFYIRLVIKELRNILNKQKNEG